QKPIDISSTSGLESIEIVMLPEGGGEEGLIKKPATVMFPDVGVGHAEFMTKGGWVRYDWEPEDVESIGQFRAEFDLIWGTDQIETVPNQGYFSIIIQADLG